LSASRPSKYYCKHCRQLVTRKSDKAWIKSWCGTMDLEVRLQRVTKENRARVMAMEPVVVNKAGTPGIIGSDIYMWDI
jgi:hypothetical protein